MKKVSHSALVPFSSSQMFNLINDVRAYPEFMTGCIRADVLEESDSHLIAELELKKAGITQVIKTKNTLNPPHSMHMHLLKGPFKQFEGTWQFSDEADGQCRVSFEVAFKLSNPLLTIALTHWLESNASDQVEALCARARQVYG